MASPFLLSAQAAMLAAFLSALSRAGLNIIDRHQIGFQHLSISQVNLWNNIIPALLAVIFCTFLGLGHELLEYLFQWKTLLFSLLVQLVAYSFSFAFRYLKVNQVTITAKFSDLFIPIGIFLTTRHWSWSNYNFAVATTLLCLPMAWKYCVKKEYSLSIGFFITAALVLQASLAPLLFKSPMILDANIRHALIFTIAVLLWRSAWSLIPMLLHQQKIVLSDLFLHPLFFLRSLLTIATQGTFIMAISSPNAFVAWPILNSTGIFALFLSRYFLKEKQTTLEQTIVIGIALLELIRFFSL